METEKLKKSPMFNLFLSSKELFHSNFIHWLISIDKEGMSQVFSKLIGENLKIRNSEREKKKFDLWIECEDGIPIIIENKFKSLINEDQLKKYDNNLQGIEARKVLLSLSNGEYEKNLCEKRWKVVSYGDLCRELRKFDLNGYHKSILQDYCSFVDEIVSHFSQKDYSKYSLSNMKEEYEKLKDFRLHDLQQKIWFSHLLIKIQKKKFIKENSDKVKYWPDFSRGTGYISFDYGINRTKESEFRLELQLQYTSLKLMLTHYNGPRNLPKDFRDSFFGIIEELSEESKYCRKKGEIFPKNKGKKYNKYGRHLIYKSVKLADDLSFDEVVYIFSKVFKEVIEFGQDYEKSLSA